MLNNYPPGVSGNEPEIVGSDKETWPWLGTIQHKGQLRYFWSDALTEEPIGPFDTEAEALQDLEATRGGYFCSEQCAQSFAEDRIAGLVYGHDYFMGCIRDYLCWYDSQYINR